MIVSQKKDAISRLIASLNSEQLHLLKAITALLKDILPSHVKRYCARHNYAFRHFNELLTLLKEKGLATTHSGQTFLVHEAAVVLDPHLRTEVLLLIAQDDEATWDDYTDLIELSCMKGPYDFTPELIYHNLQYILEYMREEKIRLFHFVLPWQITTHYLSTLLPVWTDYPTLYPLLEAQGEEVVAEAIGSRVSDCLLQGDLVMIRGVETFLSYTQKNFTALRMQEQLFLVARYLYRGDFDTFNKQVERIQELNPLVRFVYFYFQGKTHEAMDLYDQLLRFLSPQITKRMRMTGILFIDFLYVCTLMRHQPAGIKKILLLLLNGPEMQAFGYHYKSVRLLIQVALQSDPSKVELMHHVFDGEAVNDLLYAMTIQRYGVRHSVEAYEQAVTSLQGDGLQLFAPALAYEKIFPASKELAPWERTLGILMGEIKPGEGIPMSRIVYLINDSLEVQPRLQKSKDGIRFTKGRSLSLKQFKTLQEGMTAFDREVVDMMQIERRYTWSRAEASNYQLGGFEVIKKLVGHPAVFLQDAPSVAVDIQEVQPTLAITQRADGYYVAHNLGSADLHELQFTFWDGATRLRVVELSESVADICRMMTQVSPFPLAACEKLMEVIAQLSKEITIHSDLLASDLDVKQVETDSRLVLQMMPMGTAYKVDVFVKPLGHCPPYCRPGQGNEALIGQWEGETLQVMRHRDTEEVYLRRLQAHLDHAYFMDGLYQELDGPVDCLEFLDQVFGLEYVQVEWPEGGQLRVNKHADFSSFSIALKGKGNWFEVVGDLKLSDDASLDLADLLEQLHENPRSRFISLGNNEYVALTERLRRKLQAVESMVSRDKKGAMQLSAFAAPILSNWEKEGVQLRSDQSYKRLLDRISTVSEKEYRVPSQLQASLRPYQEDGFRWMARLAEWGAGACLADDMGLGKTLQTIALLLYRAAEGPSLVVAPASVLLNWEQEIRRFAPSLNVKVMHGAVRRRVLIKQAGTYDVVLTTYGLLVSEQSLLADKAWNVVALDEAHAIKNKETQMSRAAMRLQAKFRLLLTGTPLQNHLGEIWNLFQFMNPGLLGSFEQFHAKFTQPIVEANSKAQRDLLKRLVSPFLLRRIKSEVLDELPGKTEIVLSVELNAYEMRIYEAMRQRAERQLESGKLGAVQTLSEITKLRQAASHIGLVREGVEVISSKMKAFFDLLEEMQENGHRALVFSQFTSHLALFRKELERKKVDYLYLDGSTPVPQRAELVKTFQTGEQPLFLISLKAGGLGLNLTAADFIIHLDPWWNPAIEDQASDRAYRIGQKRPVTVYRLIAAQTIEEKIIALHQTKKDLANSLLEGANQSHKLTREELLDLVKLA